MYMPINIVHSLLQLCAKRRIPMNAKSCHAQVLLHFGVNAETLTSNMLINVYSKCGLMDYARRVFDKMPERCLVSWNTMIATYTRNGEEDKALRLFVEMRSEGNSMMSEFTVSSVICASAAKCDTFVCKQLHAFALKAAMDANVFVGTALVDVYAKSGLIVCATRVFEGMQERSAVTWSCMVAGYVQNELYEEALFVFNRARATGLECNQFTMSSVSCACAGLAASIEGRQVHAVVYKTGFGLSVYVAASLVDLYAKCGSVKEAYVAFSDAQAKNIVLWNVMISGFAKHAHSLEVMILFEKMQQTGICPDEITYVSVLTACSHMGLVDRGQNYFNLMSREHNVLPNVLHYSCMVDILARAGKMHEAHELINDMPFGATAPMWGSILASCRVHGNLELAEIAAKNLFEIEPDNAGNYVLLANAYGANKKWKDAAKARKILKEIKVKKETGKSWIEVKKKVHTFIVGETRHPRIADIYTELDTLLEEMKKLGYKADTSYDLHDVDENRKQELLRHHSEKLALTYGLMCLPPGASIRIMKNLRICGDCHSFMKLASAVSRREIIVRDVNRFHHFKDGYCSCREFW
ncbi:pentatricopeptide repeat-containing protein At5g04780, mitochondrial [Mercurialis annua]|uniref:pentatricopeptide repeat-containing protein At5g04780, mitochondrial n=1 Tax=Mercurialis annua TaxID=3986 RepID=UPI002160C120|nr:pentatricopeptide repeat-containing protein At5g04780, mitochondrial [Mercurialis annua]